MNIKDKIIDILKPFNDLLELSYKLLNGIGLIMIFTIIFGIIYPVLQGYQLIIAEWFLYFSVLIISLKMMKIKAKYIINIFTEDKYK